VFGNNRDTTSTSKKGIEDYTGGLMTVYLSGSGHCVMSIVLKNSSFF